MMRWYWQLGGAMVPLSGCGRMPRARRLLTQRHMSRTWLWLAMTLSASLAFARPVGGCPNCAEGREARAQVWTDDFGLNLFLALAPFLIIGAVSAWASRIGRPEMLGPSPSVGK